MEEEINNIFDSDKEEEGTSNILRLDEYSDVSY
jgi:hypothetical protein